MAHYSDIATRASIVCLKACSGKTSAEIAAILGVSVRQVNRVYARAIERGFDPKQRPLSIRNNYVQDAPKSGRPSNKTGRRER
ncbi:hypothetical protein DCS_00990 [Drechmeria coniospora]|uniref:RNA polymerase sigma factor 70 region 4 type 2 domain-containing protein n=1 Tax=Drechmeria coniospora TaxID=98403 RepID=A0A151GRX4_DRECN|nr:hypothetical protein DCS_00990 [Drechmeria coniospora]KAH8836250.1 hypothetical protein RJ55_10019 [Drechmeria coniospora]KYK59856.1 hypothetical protein DCS_00990 [Drechmeria coniospora]